MIPHSLEQALRELKDSLTEIYKTGDRQQIFAATFLAMHLPNVLISRLDDDGQIMLDYAQQVLVWDRDGTVDSLLSAIKYWIESGKWPGQEG